MRCSGLRVSSSDGRTLDAITLEVCIYLFIVLVCIGTNQFWINLLTAMVENMKKWTLVSQSLVMIKASAYNLKHKQKSVGKPRECHNHKSQPNLDIKRKRKKASKLINTRKINNQLHKKDIDQLSLPRVK